MAVHWVGVAGGCEGHRLDGTTCLTKTPVYLTSDVKMTVNIVEDYEYRVRRFLRRSKVKKDTRPAMDSCEIDVPVNKEKLRSESWLVPGPAADNPKGERTFRVPYTNRSGADQLGPIIKSSGLGSFNWTEFTQAPDVTAGFGLTLPNGFSFGPHIKTESNSSTTKEGVFTATVDPEITVELLVPGNGLDEYLHDYLRWMAGDTAEQGELDGIVDDLVSISSRSQFDARVEPHEFSIEAGGWQDISLTVDTGESATFFAAIRFRATSGEVYVTDLLSVSTEVQPASTEQLVDLFGDFPGRRRPGVWPLRYGFGPIIWVETQELPSEGEE
jgi:hypothetical protein